MADAASDGLAKMLEDENESQEPRPQGPDGKELEDWELPKFRTKVKERIQEEILKTGSQVPKTGDYLEEFAFSRAKTRKQYLDLNAGILIYVAEFNKRGQKAEDTSGDIQNAGSSETES